MSKKLNRRKFLALSASSAAGLLIASCAPAATPVAPIKETVVVEKEKVVEKTTVVEVEKVITPELPSKYSEAPALAQMVSEGKLPKIDERLPENPIVVLPIKNVGKYGGTWHRGWTGIKDFHCFGRLIYEPILRWPRDPKDAVQPGLAEAWEWSDEGKTLTLHLRKGLKWSDGAPFGVDDILFWWENIETDTNVTKAPHAEWVVAGKPMELEKVDDVTVKLKFAAPNGLAETVGLAFHGNQWPLGFERFGFFAPAHYLKEFHPKTNSSATYEIFEQKVWEYNPERPAMTPWIITDWKEGADHMTATRNPYYWKVDVEGNQLPYIDEIYFYLVDGNPAINTLALQGKIDMQDRGIDLSQYTVYQENAEQYDYHLLLWKTAQASQVTFFPNQSFGDAKYRELMVNPKFRQALSLAMDRDLMNEVGFLGQANPRTITVVKDSALFQPELEKLNAEYDPEKAGQLLDEIGLKLVGGKRVFADGTPVQLVVETYNTGALFDVIQLAAENWKAVGLEPEVKQETRDVYWPRACANEVMIATWGTDRGLVPMIDPIYQFPFDERSWMAPAFGTYYKTAGKEGEAPSAEMKQLQDLYDQYRGTVDPAEQTKIAKEIVKLSTENLHAIGTVGEAPALVVVKNNFYNVSPNHTSDWLIMTPGTMDPCHFWMDTEA